MISGSSGGDGLLAQIVLILTGGCIGILAEPIKHWVDDILGDKRQKKILWRLVYREFADNYLQVKDLLSGETQPNSVVPVCIVRTMLHTECFEEAQRQPLIFRVAEEARWFEVAYRSFSEWKELCDSDEIRYKTESWYNSVQYDLRHCKALKGGLRDYIPKSKRKLMELDSPPSP